MRYFLDNCKKLISIALLSLSLASAAQQKTVMLDYFYNSEVKKNADGSESLYRYTWDSKDLRSYSIWGNIMGSKGIKLTSLETKATKQALKNAIAREPKVSDVLKAYKDSVHPFAVK